MATRAARFTGRLVSTPFDQSMYDSAVGKSQPRLTVTTMRPNQDGRQREPCATPCDVLERFCHDLPLLILCRPQPLCGNVGIDQFDGARPRFYGCVACRRYRRNSATVIPAFRHSSFVAVSKALTTAPSSLVKGRPCGGVFFRLIKHLNWSVVRC